MDGYSTTPGAVVDTILRVLGDPPTPSEGGYPLEANFLQRRVVRLGAIRPSLMGDNLNHLQIIALTICAHTTVSFRGTVYALRGTGSRPSATSAAARRQQLPLNRKLR